MNTIDYFSEMTRAIATVCYSKSGLHCFDCMVEDEVEPSDSESEEEESLVEEKVDTAEPKGKKAAAPAVFEEVKEEKPMDLVVSGSSLSPTPRANEAEADPKKKKRKRSKAGSQRKEQGLDEKLMPAAADEVIGAAAAFPRRKKPEKQRSQIWICFATYKNLQIGVSESL